MIELGILEEGAPIELLDGLLVYKDRGGQEADVTVNPLHGLIVTRIMNLASAVRGRGFHLRIQQPITIPPAQEPEPDAAIVRGEPDDYATRHPGAEDVAVVIEVADSSLKRDRGIKQRIYAAAGIPQYLIVNLSESVIEIYEQPEPDSGRYGRTTRLESAAAVCLRLGDAILELPARDWLP
jgi:Uma2 family endonuclease